MKLEPQNNASPVRAAIEKASTKTGVDFDFLLATAKRESSLNPLARAKTSSAKGLFQFLDQTWLSTLKRHGPRHGLSNEAAQINIDSNGRYYVADSDVKSKLLNLRYDPEISSVMAAEFASDNGRIIKNLTGTNPQAGDLYAAHFLGAKGAADLINAASDSPSTRAASLFPAAANANRPIFYKNGEALSVAQVLDNLRQTANNAANKNGNDRVLPSEYNRFDFNGKSGLDDFMMAMQLNQNLSALKMLNGDKDGKSSNFNPLMLAQLYQHQDDSEQMRAMNIIQSLFDSQTLASALSPNSDNGSEA